MTVLRLATTNSHKLTEFHGLLASAPWNLPGHEPFTVSDLTGLGLPEAPEDQPTFAGNARAKALFYANLLKEPCIADDSGLVVDLLSGEPGVRSARWAPTNDERLRKLAKSVAQRMSMNPMMGPDGWHLIGPTHGVAAYFVCAMAIVWPDGTRQLEAEGRCHGLIVSPPRGQGGFGYDPMFFLPERKCTMAQLPPDAKNALSHRGQAWRSLGNLWIAYKGASE